MAQDGKFDVLRFFSKTQEEKVRVCKSFLLIQKQIKCTEGRGKTIFPIDYSILDKQALNPPSPKMCFFIIVKVEKPVYQNCFFTSLRKMKVRLNTLENIISSLYSLFD